MACHFAWFLVSVLLYELAGPALIVPAPTGITYRNQTGGYSCYQSEMEGYLFPIAGEKSEFVERLFSHFFGPKWGGWCSDGIDAETADEVDRLLAEVAHRKDIVVDRDKLNQSWEAWVHVKIRGQTLEVRFGRPEAIGVVTSSHLSTRQRDSSLEKIPFRRRQNSENFPAVRKARAP